MGTRILGGQHGLLVNRRLLRASPPSGLPRLDFAKPRTCVVSARGSKPHWGNAVSLYMQLVGICRRLCEISQGWTTPLHHGATSALDSTSHSRWVVRPAYASRSVVDGVSPVRGYRWSRDCGQLQVIPGTVMGARGQASQHTVMVADPVTLDPECCAEVSTQARQVLIAGWSGSCIRRARTSLPMWASGRTETTARRGPRAAAEKAVFGSLCGSATPPVAPPR